MTEDAEPVAHSEHNTLLLVDDEENILASLRRLLRRDGYRILTASGGEQGLEVIAKNDVDVIVSDQRMPNMTGTEFLRKVKDLSPETVRIVLSGYTELQSITDAINEGAIYKFLTKPWDDEQLRANIAEAFHHKKLRDENERLRFDLQLANQDLASVNERLHELLEEQQRQLQRDEASLHITQEVLQIVPLAVIGFDEEGMVVFSNVEADSLLGRGASLLTSFAGDCLPTPLLELLAAPDGSGLAWPDDKGLLRVICREMGRTSHSRGRVLIFMPGGDVP
jgi:YesN/AraC family two-component response regulator